MVFSDELIEVVLGELEIGFVRIGYPTSRIDFYEDV
jgi:hypothetical protein